MKICFILSASNSKGANAALMEFVPSLKYFGYDSFFILPSVGEIELDLKREKIRYSIYPYKLWMAGPKYAFLKKAARILSTFFYLPLVC